MPETAPSHKAYNRLAESKSPYLLQHADNPIAWFPCGKKAFDPQWGGIFDYIGLGFHRYSVDERWRVPHFEKMQTVKVKKTCFMYGSRRK